MLENQLRNHDAFSVATLIYARLRRVSGRVIDAIYLAENLDYARHVIQLAEQDPRPRFESSDPAPENGTGDFGNSTRLTNRICTPDPAGRADLGPTG